MVLRLNTPWRDGATHLVLRPQECMQRLAALVLRPRLIRFHGVLTPNAKLRGLWVKAGSDNHVSASASARHGTWLRAHRVGARQPGPAAQA